MIYVAPFTARIKPTSVLGLLTTVVLLFGFQGSVITGNPFIIVLLATPILIQSDGIFAIADFRAWRWNGRTRWLTGLMKTQIDWIPLSEGAVRIAELQRREPDPAAWAVGSDADHAQSVLSRKGISRI